MEEEMNTKELIQHTQELLDEAEDEYVETKHKIIEMNAKLVSDKEIKFNEQDWVDLGIDKITKQNKYIDSLFEDQQKEINTKEKEKDELYYRVKQLTRRNLFLMEVFKQEGIDKMFEDVEE